MDYLIMRNELLIIASFRFIHLLCAAILIGRILNINIQNEIFHDSDLATSIYICFYTLIILSGYSNFYLYKIKEKLKKSSHTWKRIVYLKLFLSIIISPFFNLMAENLSINQTVIETLQIITLIFFLLICPFLRYYREYHTEKNESYASISLIEGNELSHAI